MIVKIVLNNVGHDCQLLIAFLLPSIKLNKSVDKKWSLATFIFQQSEHCRFECTLNSLNRKRCE